ncbi:MAG: EAL domain-containing protein [Acidiferrobacterales bacterium]
MSKLNKLSIAAKLSDPHRGADEAQQRTPRLISEQVRLLYRQAISGFVATLLNAVFLVAVLWQVVARERLLAWAALIVIITLSRYGLVRAYRRASDTETNVERWRLWFIVGAGAAGVGWGLAGTVLFPTDSVFHQAFLAFLLGGMVAGAAPYLAAVKSAYVSFLLPVLLPFAGLLLMQGDSGYAFMGAMVLLFGAAMWATAVAINATITRSLQLRFENIELIQDLSSAQGEVERSNEELEVEIEQRKQAQADLFQKNELAQITLESIGDGVITTDIRGVIEYVNPAAEQLTGWPNGEARGLPLAHVLRLIDETTRHTVPDPTRHCLQEGRSFHLSGHTLLVHRDDDREFSIEVTVSPIHDRERQGVGTVLVFHDATEIRGMARRMSYRASHDALTGLINRAEFELRLQQALESARNEGRQHAMCYLDLDQFKVVNDMCGHMAGDQLLRQLAPELQVGVREADTLARLGGDEFGVLLEGCPMDQAEKIAEGLRQIVQDFRFAWQDRVFEVGVSIGLLPITADSGSLTEVLSTADSACYMAKDHGRHRVHVHRPDAKALAQRHGDRRRITRIEKALQEERVHLYRQQAMPLSAKAKERDYSEILIRMFGESGELIPTTAFLPPAKRYNLMPMIDRWVLEKFCSIMHETQSFSRRAAEIFAINLSGQSLSDERFLDFVVDRLQQSTIGPENICFEITETAAIANLTRAMRFIAVLKDMGCQFALDDFGSGLSSFAYLKNLQVDYLKIDGSFIRDTADDPVDYAMVTIINQIGHVMDIRTIAESVEQRNVLKKLEELGVDYAQGFEIAEPQPIEQCFTNAPPRKLVN